ISTLSLHDALLILQAAVLRVKLPHLDRWNDIRRSIARRYAAEIKNSGIICPLDISADYVAHLFVVRCSEPHPLRQRLLSANIATDIHYPIPDHRQALFASEF